MKVLFVGAGRRVSLAERFIKAGFEVFSYETELNCPISTITTIIEGKKWKDPIIIDHLFNTIRSYNIDLVLPLADPATALLSQMIENNPELASKIPTSSTKANNICLNKKIFEQTFKDKDYYPNIIENKDVIIKPIFGANSKGIKKLSWKEFDNISYCYDYDYVAQRLVNNNFEISVDAYFNKQSQLIGAIPRERIEVQGGEVNRSITLINNICGITNIVKNIGKEIKLIGPICAQFIVEDNKVFILEINARAGGGIILSLEAGLDIVKLIKEEYIENKTILPSNFEYKEGLYMTRYFKEHFYE